MATTIIFVVARAGLLHKDVYCRAYKVSARGKNQPERLSRYASRR